MEFRIAPAARSTGLLLERLVHAERGDLAGLVCYGSGYSGPLPALNRQCSRFDKLEQAQRLLASVGNRQAVVPLDYADACRAIAAGPILGRKRKHTQGRDIRLCLESWHLDAVRFSCDFFVPYQPSIAEWRTWVYRKRHLGSYRKELVRPEEMRRVGRNHGNGFCFQRVELEDTPDGLKDLARRAMAALHLDFGAVDVLETVPGQFMVLEVNTAPGVSDERRAVIRRLAHRIVRWAEEGHPNAVA